MKKVCFIVSHLGSGSDDLVRIINDNPACTIYNSQNRYDSPESLNWMFSSPHKRRDNSAIYGDHLLYNPSMSHKSFFNFCKFIYVIRPARPSLNSIISTQGKIYSENYAANYYRFRLRRICEMARKTPRALFLSWDDLASGRAFSTIEEYLGLNDPIKVSHEDFVADYSDSVRESIVKESQDAYERYYYYLNNINLKRCA